MTSLDFAPSYEKLPDLDALRTLVSRVIAEGKPFAHDVETSYDGEPREKASLHPEENFLVSWQFTNALTWARMVPLRFGTGINCDNREVARILWPLFQAKDAEGKPLGVAHGAVFEMRCMRRWFLEYLGDDPDSGEQVRACDGFIPVRSCTMLESYVEAENPKHGLKVITKANFGHEMREILSLFPEGLTAKQQRSIRFSVLDPDDPEVIAYACEDALWCLRHHLERYPKVKDNPVYKLEMAFLPAVAEMADEGLLYDWNLMRDGALRGREFAERYLAEVMADFSELAGEQVAISFSSPKQLADLLYNKCGMPIPHWTKGGKSGNKQPSTDAKIALPELAKKYPPVQKYLNWKRITTLCGSFLDKYERDFSYAPDGRAHPSLIQHGTITGRPSCEEPNFQQSPKKYHLELQNGEAFDFNFRDCIAAPPGWYFLGFDYSQIQLRVAAGEADEATLLQAFEEGKDTHRLTAALLHNKRQEDVTDDERSVGKTFNFALLFGLTVQGMADRLGCSLEHAEHLFAQFHSAYPALKRWSERIIVESRRTGYVSTRFGRKVPIWEYKDADKLPYDKARVMRQGGERTAGNAPIQGGEADYVKLAVVKARHALREAGLAGKVKLVMHVHDALEFYVRKDVSPAEVIKVLQPAVVFPVEGWPPMAAAWHMGYRWGSVVELEVSPDFTVRPKVKGAKPAPGVKEPEEAANGAETDDLDRGALAAPAAVASAPEPERAAGPGPDVLPGAAVPGGPARKVIVVSHHTPGGEQVQALLALADSLPGRNTAELRIPDATARFPRLTGLTPDHEPQVSIILGGAAVYYALDSVDFDSMADGLSF